MVKREESYCKTCEINVVEDEYHYLYICESLKYIRTGFLKEYFTDYDGLIAMSDKDKPYNYCQRRILSILLNG